MLVDFIADLLADLPDGKWIVEGRFYLIDDHDLLGAKDRRFSWEMVSGPHFLRWTAKRIQKRYAMCANNWIDDDQDEQALITREYRVTKI